MSGNRRYLFAAYAVTWVIHITYLWTDRPPLRTPEAGDRGIEKTRCQALGLRYRARGFIADDFPET